MHVMLWITAHVLHRLARQGYEPAAVGSLEVILIVNRVRSDKEVMQVPRPSEGYNRTLKDPVKAIIRLQ